MDAVRDGVARASGARKVRWQMLPCSDVESSDEFAGARPRTGAAGALHGLQVGLQQRWAAGATPCVQRAATVGFGALGCMVVLAAGLVLYASAITKSVVIATSSRIFGTDVEVGSLIVGVLEARTFVEDVSVANPSSYNGHFLELQDGLVDLTFWSLFSKHVEVEELQLRGLTVTLEQKDASPLPNFVYIIDNLIEARHRKAKIYPPSFLGGRIAARLFTVDRLDIRDLTFQVDMQAPSLGLVIEGGLPLSFTIDRVQIQDIGKHRGGVHVAELIHIIVDAVLGAAVEQAPGYLAAVLLAALAGGTGGGAQGLESLDFGSLHLDVGQGLRRISNLMDRLSEADANVAPLAGAVQAAADVSTALASAVGNASVAWIEALSEGGDQAFVDEAIHDTVAAFGAAAVGAAARTRKDGIVGGLLSEAIEAQPDTVTDLVNRTAFALGTAVEAANASGYPEGVLGQTWANGLQPNFGAGNGRWAGSLERAAGRAAARWGSELAGEEGAEVAEDAANGSYMDRLFSSVLNRTAEALQS